MASGNIEKFHNNGQSTSAAQKRAVQLKEWEKSVTNKQPSTIISSRLKPTIKFADSVVFLAAAHSGDTVEVEKLVLNEGADVNSVSKDGLTALHQCCIDDDFEMVKTLVRLGANVDQQDKEGWTPLHAASSCGNTHIVGFLLEHGAFPALVNNEGDTPLDIAEDTEEIVELLQERIDRDMIDMEAVRGVEEAMMLEDANRLKNDHTLKPLLSHADATPLHVAAAKNYLQVMRVLLTLKASQVQVDAVDEDGWTPLHAAIYWGNFEAAEILVTHGASIDKKTNTGDTIEDLCEPELEEELDTLKRFQNNRQRSNAMSKPRQLLHSNSREDMSVKPHTSPLVRRRSSKERSMFPKMDIAKEREEREIFAQETGDYSSTANTSVHITSSNEGMSPPLKSNLKVNQNALVGKPTTSETREYLQDSSNSSKDSQSDMSKGQSVESSRSSKSTVPEEEEDPSRSPDPSPSDTPQGSPPQKPKAGSPKTGKEAKKKFTGMSPKMLMRVEKWESHTNIVTPPPSAAPANSSSSPRSLSSSGRGPIASSTPTNPSNLQTSSNGDNPARYSVDTKRYSFQPKTISPATSFSSLPPRSMSVDRPPINNAKSLLAPKKLSLEDRITVSSHVKRSSYDETNTKRILNPSPEEDGYKASSLPRSVRISKHDSATTDTTTNRDKKHHGEAKKETESSAVATEASATPGAHTDVSTGPGQQQTDTSSLLEVTPETKREQSVESNTSSRGALNDSETNRKINARKNRQNRKQTQPVPADLMEQISKHKGLDPSSTQLLSSDVDQDSTSDSNPTTSTGENSPAEHRKRTFSTSKISGDVTDGPASQTGKARSVSLSSSKISSDATEGSKSQSGKGTSDDIESRPPTMSSYKPRNRPSSKILNALQKESADNPPSPRMADVVEQKMKAEAALKSHGATSSMSIPRVTTPTTVESSDSKVADTSSRASNEACKADSSGLLHPRAKSTTRRKPREKRRSTGIVTEAAEGEEVPDELANLVRKSGDGAMSTSSHGDHTPDSSVSAESTATTSPHDKKEEGEMTQLRVILEEERSKSQRMQTELEETRSKVLELNRRFEDATRAYEQERRENEAKDARIEELQSSSKSLQDLKHENQRIKDENSALIRVIGKLSRSPVQHHTHT